MTMQYDVKSSHLSSSGFLALGNSTRLKQITYNGNASQAGNVNLFDTYTAPTTAVYQRTGTTITVTSTAHGLNTGAIVGIGFGISGGLSGTDGNYVITKTSDNAFTIADPNSGNTSGGIPCYYVVAYPTGNTINQYPQRWLCQFDTLAGVTGSQQVTVPGEGMVARNGMYAQMNYVGFVSIFYG